MHREERFKGPEEQAKKTTSPGKPGASRSDRPPAYLIAPSTRLTVVGLALLLLGAPIISAGDFLQTGFDMARTGNVAGDGPSEYEIAFTLELPGIRSARAPPLIVAGFAYVLLHAAQPDASGEGQGGELTETGVVRVNLDTAQIETIIQLDAPGSTLASDGTHLFLAEADRLAAYELDGAGPVWTWPWPELVSSPEAVTWCAPPALDGSGLYIGCTQEAASDTAVLGDPRRTSFRGPIASAAFVAQLDTSNQAGAAWLWDSLTPEPDETSSATSACRPEGAGLRPQRLAVLGEHLIVTASREPDVAEQGASDQFFYLDMEAETGERGWTRCTARWTFNVAQWQAGQDHAPSLPALTGTTTTAYVMHDDLIAIDLETGDVTELDDVGGQTDLGGGQGPQNSGSGLAWTGTDLFVLAYDEILHYAPATGELTALNRMDNPGLGRISPLISDEILYVPAYESLSAHDPSTGALLWKHAIEIPPNPIRGAPVMTIAVSESSMVILGSYAEFSVIGRTSLSIQPSLDLSDRWPAPGENVTVDLSSSDPGLGGTLRYQADWGDGQTTAPQDEPVLEHAYTTAGTREARFIVTNDAGQRSIAVAGIDVGGERPEELNTLQTAFARENQDMTFGVLGILVAVGGGVIAVGRSHARRQRVQRELEAIELAYEQTHERPRDCEAALAERRAHVQGLGLDGKLDQAEVLLLQQRIDELARDLRLNTLEQRFHFLPYGFVMSLREMLDDGAISLWEHEHLQRAIDDDGTMTEGQKTKVRGLLDEWAERDKGGAG